MEFRIADTFTDSLARLTSEEQKAVKTTAFDLQINPANPALQFHRLDQSRDPNFWSVRMNLDIRLIVHRTPTSLLLCYVGHHEEAYRWAERRKLETHPTTGAAQLVEIRETVKEITIPKYVEVETAKPPKPLLFTRFSDDDLLRYGVPAEWLADVRQADEDTLFDLAEHLPHEATEALLEIAAGGMPQPQVVAALADQDPFDHPDARRRFRVMTNVEELARALDYPWEKWTVFLHPAQSDLVERTYNGPARVSGSAGTGKTIVALHRAAILARKNPDARILLTTFSDTLANALRTQLRRLAGNEPSVFERIEVEGLSSVGRRLYGAIFGKPRLADPATIRDYLVEAAQKAGNPRFSDLFVWNEWHEVVDAWQLDSWEAYRNVPRLGRKTRLSESQRQVLWGIFTEVRGQLQENGYQTEATLFARLATHFQENKRYPYDHLIVDEAQDIGVPQLRFLAALGGSQPEGLFFAGDLGQRIFQPPFSWKTLGVDIRGRSRTLKINYRTSHQIRSQADRLLPKEISDVDGNKEDRCGTVSVFNGPEPALQVFDDEQAEIMAVAKWVSGLLAEQFKPHEIGIFVRSVAQLDRAREVVSATGLKTVELDRNIETQAGHISICTMHLAKGLEFRAVVVMACDDEVIPLQERIETVTDESDLEDVYATERHLLYVACTRARDRLLVTSVKPASEFLDDLRGN
ncbi:MAG TPA: 3'-5' exonuclease [Anaerolineales bacterium]|nr:3'-5' exonuclease [Anaerolineales bacterium]